MRPGRSVSGGGGFLSDDTAMQPIFGVEEAAEEDM
jgi:hypothetical protein